MISQNCNCNLILSDDHFNNGTNLYNICNSDTFSMCYIEIGPLWFDISVYHHTSQLTDLFKPAICHIKEYLKCTVGSIAISVQLIGTAWFLWTDYRVYTIIYE